MRVGISSMYGSPVIATHPNRKGGADVTAECRGGDCSASVGERSRSITRLVAGTVCAGYGASPL